jgi:hypothetical protein
MATGDDAVALALGMDDIVTLEEAAREAVPESP